jgi:uncharacterized circularly permuted ATP-grasp superfamily protein/uncharacterized alpha-E superfamily protein
MLRTASATTNAEPGTPAGSKAVASALLANYRAGAGAFDELLTTDGELRPHYAAFVGELGDLGVGELKRRSETGRRLVHEQGITYNVYGDPRGIERPWELDPVPFLIGAAEWRSLEAALIQRATLLNRILADCYGSQDLIRTAWLPPALVFGQPDFLRAAHGIRAPNDTFLHFYAADLARSPDGRWWVVSDRTQIPTGSGYALANRLVTSRILPEPFRNCQVQRLAGFFRNLQEAMARVATRPGDLPRVAMLTPGPYNETYFEQSYLARYLGYSLVEGQDLAVRDERVYLKTLSGLEPVDVIVRRVDDDFCDPLELRNDSILGVPGLVEALRAGNVAVANGLGSGLLQSPAFMSFLPGLCRHLLGEPLKLPSVATWWCGQKSAERYVLDHLEDVFVKPAFRSHLRGMDPDRRSTPEELAALKRRIAFQPHLWVAQERVEFSTAPTWGGEGLVPRPVGLRVYLVATADGYRVMPGGLTRVAPETGGRFISMQRGGAAKDTWVLADGPVDDVTLLSVAGQAATLRRVGNNLPSRLADNFFWLGRYAERADATSRLLRATLLRFSPESSGNAMPLLAPLLNTLVTQGQLPGSPERPELRTNPEALEAELLAAIFDPDRRGSLRGIADQVQRLAMLVRDRTSNDLWRILNTLNERLATPASSLVMLAGDAVGVLNQALLTLAAFHGLARENMTRAQGWRFLDMGFRLERSIYLCRLLDASLRSPEADNPSVLEAALEVADSSITYRSRYNLLPNLAAVYDLVLLDDTNPRSLLFQFNQLVKHFERLPRERENALPSDGQRVLIECVARLRLLDPRPLNGLSGDWHESEVGRVIQRTLHDLPRLSDAIAVSYFAHSAISRAGGI